MDPPLVVGGGGITRYITRVCCSAAADPSGQLIEKGSKTRPSKQAVCVCVCMQWPLSAEIESMITKVVAE